MAIVTRLVSAEVLAALTEHQVDILTAAVDAEILQNAAIARQIRAKVDGLVKEMKAAAKRAG